MTSVTARSLEALDRQVHARYSSLRVLLRDGVPVLTGFFPVEHEGAVLDRFAIEGYFPHGLGSPPAILEIDGRIPRTVDRHVFTNGVICVEVPELTLVRGDYSLVPYLEGPVHNYFLGQCLVESGKPWPYGEWSHGKTGLLEAYGEILGVHDEASIRRYLDCLSRHGLKGHWPCPCGTGKRVRDCHLGVLRGLRARVPLAIARMALARLNSAERYGVNR